MYGYSRTHKTLVATAVACAFALASAPAAAGTIFFNGFETNTAGWTAFGGSFNASRVASGTNSVTSASGAFHAQNSASGSAGNWGGYNFGAGAVATAFQEYWTSADIYLNVDGGWANHTRFDYDSAINNAAGGHLRDFVFNAGFYNDNTGPGAGANRFVISASNNSQPGSAFAKNPDKGPIAITESGWYTFEHHFYNDDGVLAVDMSILDAADTLVHSWTLGGDAIAGVGGNRYGWFDYNQFGALAFDNTELRTADAPVPATLSLIGLGLAGLGFSRRKGAYSVR